MQNRKYRKTVRFMVPAALIAFAAAGSANAATSWNWTGAGGDLNWFTAANWSDGDGNAATGLASGDSFTFDAVTPSGSVNYNPSGDFNIETVTFGAGLTSAVKIAGGKIASLGNAVNNNASYAMEFANEVAFASTINLAAPAKHIVMSGGATGTTLSTSFSDLYGNFTLTADWTVGASCTVKSGSTLTTKKITNNASNSYLMNVEAGAKLVVNGDFTCYSSAKGSSPRLLQKVNGVVIVNGTATVKGNSGDPGKNTCLVGDSSSAGMVLANKFSFQCGVKGTNYHYYNIARVGAGTGGINYNNSARNYPREFYCMGNWSFGDLSSGGNGTAYNQSSIAFHTSDFLDPATGRTITATGCFNSHGGAGTNKPMTIDGCGTMLFNCAFGFGDLTVSNSATVAVNAGKRPCGGAVTMKDSSTLILCQAGTGAVALGGALAFNAGTSLVCSNLVSSVTPLTATALTLADASATNLRIEGPALAEGAYPVISLSSGTVPDSYSSLVLSGPALPEGMTSRLERSADRKMLLLTVFGPDSHVWTGAGDGTHFSDSGNWLNGNVPSAGGETVHFPAAAGALDNDLPSFAPQSMVFGAGIGALTIGGNSIAGLHAVTNLSTAANAVFTAPVEYAEGKTIATFHGGAFDNSNAKFSKELGLVIFKGGVTGYELMGNSSGSHNIYAGEYRRTNPAAYTATVSGSNYRRAIYKNSSLTVASAGNTTELFIGKGGAFTTAVQTITSRLYLSNGGEYVVNGKLTTGASECNAGYNSSVYAPANDGAVIKVGSLTIPGAGAFGLDNTGSATTNTWFIGEEGMNVASGKDGFFFTRFAGSKVTIRPWRSDFTIHAGSTAPGDIYIGAGSQTGGTVEFFTEDESGEARTITIAGRLAAREAIKSSAHIVVSGTGKVALDSVSAFYGDTKVKGGATLEINPGKKLGAGAVSVEPGATFSVPGAGPADIGGIALSADAVLSFKIDIGGCGAIKMEGGEMSLPEEGTVAVVLAEGSHPHVGGKYALTSGARLAPEDIGKFKLDEATGRDGSLSIENGELVYNAANYFMIKITKTFEGARSSTGV